MSNSAVVLINTFDVPVGDEEAFEREWDRVHEFLMVQDGYRSSQLHRSVGPHADSRYVNVAVWDSEDAFTAATQRAEFQSTAFPYPYHALPYEVVRADQHWEAPSQPLQAALA